MMSNDRKDSKNLKKKMKIAENDISYEKLCKSFYKIKHIYTNCILYYLIESTGGFKRSKIINSTKYINRLSLNMFP